MGQSLRARVEAGPARGIFAHPKHPYTQELLATAFQVEIDKVGRVLVPQSLREFAGLNGEAIVAGQGEYFEVWSPAEWEKQLQQMQDTETNNQRFAALNLGGKAAS